MKVSLFITCLADMMYPQVGESVIHLLHRYGCEVDFPELQRLHWLISLCQLLL
jgi:L-lactate dehydrogenase complex protein LldE